jgi:trimeric autotransporter adhesin
VRALLLIPLLSIRLTLCAQTWSPVGNGIKGNFNMLITNNNKLYATGIDSLTNQAVHVASWNGKEWNAADSGLKGSITAMGIYEGKIYAGTSEKFGANAIYRLMCWNDTVWERISTLNGPINALCAFKGNLYAGGKFTMADTTHAKYMARWNDTAWYPVGRNLSNNIRAIAIYHNKIYVGGQFNEVLIFNGRSWETVQGTKSIRIGGYVKSFCLYNDELYACGEFDYLAKWNETDWMTVGSQSDGASALVQYKESLYIGGDFIGVTDNPYASHIAAYNGPTMKWSCLGGTFYSGGDCKPYNGTVWSLAVYNGELYVGGQFMIAGGKIINNIARFTLPDNK